MRYAPRTASSVDGETPMELDAMQRDKEEAEEEYEEGSEEEADDALFFMEPNHDKLRAREDLKMQEYWEAGITPETISVLKQGNMDHAQKTCYHCNRKGHIKANCPARKRLDAAPWAKRTGFHEKKTTARKGFGVGRGRGKPFPKRPSSSKKRFAGGAQSIQQSEDFQ